MAVFRGSYPRYKSSLQFPLMLFIDAKFFVFIHQKTLSMAKVYIGYNFNAQTHMIQSSH